MKDAILRFFIKIKLFYRELFQSVQTIAYVRESRLKECKSINEGFFEDIDFVNRVNFRKSIKRIASNKKRDLIVDPLRMQDLIWFVDNNEDKFKTLMQSRYQPSKQITLSMPKGNLTYRPISYLLPIDSLLYQALVDNIVKYKYDKFSKYVYSNILNKISSNHVIHNPVQHWIEMRRNLRKQYENGNNIYFTTDVSGYFENIKIKKLLKLVDFYIGRNEVSYKRILEKLLCHWQYADSQGLIQTHPASSILGKIYLTPIDSELSYLNNKYSRYIDEFHIMLKSNRDVIQITMKLNNLLRELGLNLNLTKTKILRDDAIIEELDEDRDFFESANYYDTLHIYDIFIDIVKNKFVEIEQRYRAGQTINKRVFRYCIHKFQRERARDGISFSLEMLKEMPEQTIDIIKYLALFINTEDTIITYIFDIIKDKEVNLYQWQQVWLLALLLEVEQGKDLDFNTIWSIANSNDQDVLSRSICYLILSKHLEDNELIILKRHYETTDSIVLKRVLLFCLERLPKTFTADIMTTSEDEDISIYITKEYIKHNRIDWTHVLAIDK